MNNILSQFLSLLEVPHTRYFANTLYGEHPHRYDMYGLRSMLAVYGIISSGVKIGTGDLASLTYPCILHIEDDFVLGLGCDSKNITYQSRGRRKKVSHESFSRIWTGHALIVEDCAHACEPDFAENRRQDISAMLRKLSVPLVLLLLVVLGIIHNGMSLAPWVMGWVLLDLFGLYACVLLMQRQLYGESRQGDSVCALFKHAGCEAILSTEEARLLGVSWSEVGLGYFSANLLLQSALPASMGVVSIVNAMAMLFGVWSVLYQWRVARRWCALCLLVQAVVWCMGLCCLPHAQAFPSTRNPLVLGACLATYVSLVMLSHLYASYHQAMEERMSERQKINAMKSNESVARALLEASESHLVSDEDSTIIFGNPAAKMRVSILSNPHCSPCSRMHRRVGRLLALHHDELCVQYIFSSFNEQLENSSRYLISCYDSNDQGKSWELFGKWFSQDKFHHEEFLRSQVERLFTRHVEEEMERHRKWRKREKLTATPTVIVNNRMLPGEYEIEDLGALLDITQDKPCD